MSRSGARRDAPLASPVVPWVAFAASLILYIVTCAPGLLWSDSAKHAIFVAQGELLGYGHGRHPLHTLAGMLLAELPLPLPYTQNLLSALAGAAAIGLVAAASCHLASPAAALLASLALALSHTPWLYSVINETYSLLWAFLAWALLLALRYRTRRRARDLVLLALASGLAFSAHGLAAVALPGIGLLACSGAGSRPRPGALVAAAGALALGLTLVWLPALLPAREGAREALGLFAKSLEHARLFLRPEHLARELALYPAYLAFQLPGLGIAALALGVRRLWAQDRSVLTLLAASTLPIVLFASSYLRPRQFAMLGASYLLLAPLVAVGLDRLLRHVRAPLLALPLVALPVVTYAIAAEVAGGRLAAHGIRTLPYRDEARYFLWPPKRAVHGAERYVAAAQALLPRGATLIADFNAGEPLRYAIEVDRSLDLRLLVVIDDLVHAGGDPGPRIEALLDRELAARTPVFLADRYEPYYRVSYLASRFALADRGPFLAVTRRQETRR